MICGCDDEHACMHPELGPCSWVAEELCSWCELRAFRFGPFAWATLDPHERLPLFRGYAWEVLAT